MPKNVEDVVWPFTFDALTGASIRLQRESLLSRLFEQILVSAGKNHLNNVTDG